MRSDGDSWGISEGVGATALLTAAGRALEARKVQPLAEDPYAAMYCDAAGGDWADLVYGNAPFHPLAQPGFGDNFVNFQGARTRFFDDFLHAALAAGVRQVVILASGLDSRAHRLSWPLGTALYELDRASVLEWKRAVAHEYGIYAPDVDLRDVPVDLRDNWQAALADAGFDATAPSAWLAEGLLLYLPTDARVALFAGIDCQAAPGSRLAVNDSAPIDPVLFDAAVAEEIATEQPPHFQLIYNDPDAPSVVSWFSERDWAVDSVPVGDFLVQAGRPEPGRSIARDALVSAVKRIESPS